LLLPKQRLISNNGFTVRELFGDHSVASSDTVPILHLGQLIVLCVNSPLPANISQVEKLDVF
jgi:hypothetical protein